MKKYWRVMKFKKTLAIFFFEMFGKIFYKKDIKNSTSKKQKSFIYKMY